MQNLWSFRCRRVVDLKLPNDAGLRALTVVLCENLVVLVLDLKVSIRKRTEDDDDNVGKENVVQKYYFPLLQ